MTLEDTMLDCVIRGGMLIDGTGAARRQADIGIKDGRIAAIGTVTEAARETIDATGKVVAPGFIDVHTHYDAQIMWDPALTPSSLHGVTTVLGGNCGFTIAPIAPSSADYVIQMLATVEGMPVESLREGLNITWSGFGDWLDLLDGKVGLNVGFLAGHSTIRRLVMGDDWRRAATEAEIATMRALVDQSVSEGALGFSSSWGHAHADHQGNPVPSRFAEHGELVELASTLRDHPGTMLEFIAGSQPFFPQASIDVMVAMSKAAQKPLNWNVLSIGTGIGDDAIKQRLDASDYAATQGAKVVALVLPIPQIVRITMNFLGFNILPEWRAFLAHPREHVVHGMADPATRAMLMQDVEENGRRHVFDFANFLVENVTNPELTSLEGRVLSDIAAGRGVTPVEAFLDIQLADELRAVFKTGAAADEGPLWEKRRALWNDPRTLLGASDAGAHLDSLDSFVLYSEFVGPVVRRGLISLEDAVHKITDAPARFYGLRERGRIETGWHADIVVFDADTIASHPLTMRKDMPGGQSRLFAGADGVDHVLVAGTTVSRRGELTGALPGTVLRSGRDTGE